MKLTQEQLQEKADKVFELHKVDECFVTTDGMPFLSENHAISHCKCTDLRVIKFSRGESESEEQKEARLQAEKEIEKEELNKKIESLQTKEDAQEMLKGIDPAAVDISLCKALNLFLELKTPDKKNVTLIEILQLEKTKLLQTAEETK